MSSDASLNQLKRKAYLAYHQDGIVDILIGATVLGFALWIFFDTIIFTFMAWMGGIVYAGLKNAITIPRFGYVRFDETRTQSTRAIGVGIALILLILVIGVLFFISPDRIPVSMTDFLRKYFAYLLSGLGVLAIAIMGMVSGIRRLLVYAAVMITVLGLSLQMQLNGAFPLLVSGSLILLIGIGLLVNFIRRYPLQPSEAEDVA
jgi:hypothetical protein